MESLRESRTDTVAHFALHEVPFDTSLYQQVARATTRLATKYVDVVMSSVCVRWFMCCTMQRCLYMRFSNKLCPIAGACGATTK